MHELIESARTLGPFSEDDALAYQRYAPRLVALVNERMTEREDIHDLLGVASLELMRDNHANHARFIGSILKVFQAEVLVETIIWVLRTYKSRGISSAYWAAQLNTWHIVISETLKEAEVANVLELYAWIQVHLPVFDKLAQMESGQEQNL